MILLSENHLSPSQSESIGGFEASDRQIFDVYQDGPHEPTYTKQSSRRSGQCVAFVDKGVAAAATPFATTVDSRQSTTGEPIQGFAVLSVSPRLTKRRKISTGCVPIQLPKQSSYSAEYDPAGYIQAMQSTTSPIVSPNLRALCNPDQYISPASSPPRVSFSCSDGRIDGVSKSFSMSGSRGDSPRPSIYHNLKLLRVNSRRSETISSADRSNNSPPTLQPGSAPRPQEHAIPAHGTALNAILQAATNDHLSARSASPPSSNSIRIYSAARMREQQKLVADAQAYAQHLPNLRNSVRKLPDTILPTEVALDHFFDPEEEIRKI